MNDMTIDSAKDNLLKVVGSGRILLNDEPLNLRELAELQENIMLLYTSASQCRPNDKLQELGKDGK